MKSCGVHPVVLFCSGLRLQGPHEAQTTVDVILLYQICMR